MEIDAQRANAIAEANVGDLPEGHSIRVAPVGAGVLWSVA